MPAKAGAHISGDATVMRVFVFDLLAYDRHFDFAKAERYLPYPLPGEHFEP